jgi:hypothetical protein
MSRAGSVGRSIAVSLGATALVTTTASAALAAPAGQLVDVERQARGAQVLLTLNAQCDPGFSSTGFVNVVLRQRVSGKLVLSGSASNSFPCGGPVTVEVPVATDNGRPWRTGAVAYTLSVAQCEDVTFTCQSSATVTGTATL